jgi:hypothetical protein
MLTAPAAADQIFRICASCLLGSDYSPPRQPRSFRVFSQIMKNLRRDHPHLAGDGPRPVRAGSGLPLVSDRSVRSGLQAQARLRVYLGRYRSACAGCPAGTVALGAGGADTHTQRAIPGSESSRRITENDIWRSLPLDEYPGAGPHARAAGR